MPRDNLRLMPRDNLRLMPRDNLRLMPRDNLHLTPRSSLRLGLLRFGGFESFRINPKRDFDEFFRLVRRSFSGGGIFGVNIFQAAVFHVIQTRRNYQIR